MNIDYTVNIWTEEEQFIAHAMPLDVMSAGQTVEEARKALDEAVHLFLATAADMDTLQDVLREAGYQWSVDNWIAPPWVSTEQHSALVGI